MPAGAALLCTLNFMSFISTSCVLPLVFVKLSFNEAMHKALGYNLAYHQRIPNARYASSSEAESAE